MKKTITDLKIQAARIECAAQIYQEIAVMISNGTPSNEIVKYCGIMTKALLQQTNILNKELDIELGVNEA